MSLRYRLVVLTLAIVLPAVAAAAWIIGRAYASERGALEQGLRETARALSLVVERELDKREVVAKLLADSSTLDDAPDLSAVQRRDFYAQAKRATEGLAGWVVLSSPLGQVLNTFLPPDQTPPALPAGQAPRVAFTASRPQLNPLARGRVSDRLLASVQVPVKRSGATVLNVGVTILPAELQALVDARRMPAGWIAAVVDTRGTVAARHPHPERWVGKPITADLQAQLAAHDEGSLESHNLEGVASVAYFAKSPRYGWAFVIGVPQSYFEASLRRPLAQVGVGALALLAASLAAALWVARQIARPAQALRAAAVDLESGRGVVPRPTGVREFDDVGAALARASERIASGRAELEERVDSAVTETRQAQDRLAQAQRLEALGQLTGGVAHDFNNLLAVVASSAYVLQHGEADAQRLGVAASLSRAVESGRKLTGHLLRFARGNAVRPQSIDLDVQLQSMTDLFRTALGSAVAVSTRVEPATRNVRCDVGELELALLNLAVNSRDAMPQGGEFHVVARNATSDETTGLAAGDYVAVAVSDTGAGIGPELRGRVFEPFVTTKGPGQGAGLGLSQVHGFCAQAGGSARILATSSAGTTVLLLLPASGEPAAPAAPRHDSEPGPQLQGRELLLVEDDDEVGQATERLLALFGYRVTRAAHPEAAIGLIDARQRRFDVVLSDIVMPGGMNGIDFARYLRQHFPELPVVLMTGFASRLQDAVEFRVLHKPCDPAQLAAALRDATARAAA